MGMGGFSGVTRSNFKTHSPMRRAHGGAQKKNSVARADELGAIEPVRLTILRRSLWHENQAAIGHVCAHKRTAMRFFAYSIGSFDDLCDESGDVRLTPMVACCRRHRGCPALRFLSGERHGTGSTHDDRDGFVVALKRWSTVRGAASG